MSDPTRDTAEQREHDPLARLLGAADPASGDDGLDNIERARMRATVVEAAAHHAARRAATATGRGWLQPALAAAAVATMALGLAYWTLSDGPPPGTQSTDPVTSNHPTEPSSTPRDATGNDRRPADASAPESRAGAAADRSAERAPVDSSGDAAPATADALAASSASSSAVAARPAPDTGRLPGAANPPPTGLAGSPAVEPDRNRTPRTLYFTAPRGTQIIWTLDPEYESPVTGQPARQ